VCSSDSRKAIWIFSIAAIVVLFAVTAFMPSVSAADVYPSGSIQAAINIATTGDIITVYDGTYKENLVINKSDIVIRSANGSTVTIISSNQTEMHVVNITNQTNVTLEGFEIRDAQGATQDVAGIHMYNASWCTISNNTVTNITATGDKDARGILLTDSNNNTFSGGTSVFNITAEWYAYGIELVGCSNNTFGSDTSVFTIDAENYYAYGIRLAGSNNNIFSSGTVVSTITGDYAYGIWMGSSNNNIFSSGTSVSTIIGENGTGGIHLIYSSKNNTFSSSTSVSNVTANQSAKGISLIDGSNNNTFSSSTAVFNITSTNSDAYGIYLWLHSSNNTFDPTVVNNISGNNDAFGVYLDGSHTNNFTDITVNDVNGTRIATGIYLYASRTNNFEFTNIELVRAGNLYAHGLYMSHANHNHFMATTINDVQGDDDTYGIMLSEGENNTCESTRIENISSRGADAFGITVDSSQFNTFTKTTIMSVSSEGNVDAFGLFLVWTHDNEFDECTITDVISGADSTSYGIYLSQLADNNLVSRAIIFSTEQALINYAVWLEDCSDNTVNESEIWNNGHGFWLNQSDNNTIERNLIVNNKLPPLAVSGAYLTTDSDNNELHENCFYYNGMLYQAWDNGTGNNWTGNFWDDYVPPPPYPIGGSANNSDSTPLDECLEGAAPAFWDPGDDHKMHYPQLPDPLGWDVYNPWNESGMLADDWQCTETGPVTHIHIWGSWEIDYNVTDLQVFRLEIWDDNTSGLYSKPGNDCLWQGDFNTNDYIVRWNDTGPQGFYSPQFEWYLLENHNLTYQYNFYIDPADAFNQTEGNIYWLVVSSRLNPAELEDTPLAAFGMKTSNSPHFRDDAVFWNESIDDWSELRDPIINESLDLAFVIAGEPRPSPVPQPSPVSALTPLGLLALAGLLSAIAAVAIVRKRH